MSTNPFRFTAPKSSEDPGKKRMLLRVVAAATGGLLVAAAYASPAMASPISVDLGSAASFSILAGAAATVPGSTLPGEVGAITAITDDEGTIYGSTKHPINDAATQQALVDAGSAFTSASGLAAGNTLTGSDLGGQILVPGVYHSVAALAATSAVTFNANGDPNAYFIIQGDGTLNTTASTSMVLAGGAQSSHIFWVVEGAATLGASSSFLGTILSHGAVTVGASSHFAGRAISVTAAVTLDADVFGPVIPVPVIPVPVPDAAPTVTITGGPIASTNDSTPTITGTTDAPVGTAVSVAVGGTPHTTTVLTGGVWTITVGTALPEGPVTVIASVTPTGSLTGTATQVLTIDTTAPSLTITGGPNLTTQDSTPTISGTTNAPTGSTVTITIANQTLTATVQAGGAWSATATLLPEGAANVVATVTDTNHNTATAHQVLTVKLAAAVVHHISTLVYFAGDSAVITSATRKGIAALIKRVPAGALTIEVHITGYIKLISPSTVNKALATARTHSVYNLMKGKVHGTYTLKGVGKGLSYATNARRVEVVIYYTLPSRK
jgi:outer membrane protein OmpA-like peptidoglycan-associated protein